jgi:hypothetical protein
VKGTSVLCRSNDTRRRGASVVEASIAGPVAMLMVLAIVIGAIGIFNYQQIAFVARETARFASVHGAQYAKNNADAITAGTLPNVDAAYLISYAKSRAAMSDSSQLQISIQMTVLKPGAISATDTITVDWDDTDNNQSRSPYSAWTDSSQTPSANVQVDNVVLVTVTYTWNAGLFVGPVTLTSTAVMQVSY